MYVLGLSSSRGTSRMCPAWFPCEHKLTLALSPIWGPPSEATPSVGAIYSLRRGLFIVLMIAAHISPNVFSLRNFLSNIHVLFLAYIHRHSYLSYITFNQYLHPFITRQSFRHFFNSSWQADCSQSFMSDTIRNQFLWLGRGGQETCSTASVFVY